jgi:hypothetical protein
LFFGVRSTNGTAPPRNPYLNGSIISVKFEGYADEETNESFVPMEVPIAVKSLLKPAVSRSDDVPFVLTEEAWDAVCYYLAMLDHTMPELQE